MDQTFVVTVFARPRRTFLEPLQIKVFSQQKCGEKVADGAAQSTPLHEISSFADLVFEASLPPSPLISWQANDLGGAACVEAVMSARRRGIGCTRNIARDQVGHIMLKLAEVIPTSVARPD
ncbi:hypothetical protein [Pseudooceanicola sp.]|uniref:hypothetical protein n=1 Tax=Pseudooceanicola sp. TaxID=1914328 RepID=UPI0026248BEB|nr:hypothetical protein [Pseudooceanicola sp.]MDF1855848.1 hypothetical protein [Pseudooceanicola sp.]